MKQTTLATLLFIVLVSTCVHAQELSLGQWRAHLPFIKARVLAPADDGMYCSSDRGLFYYKYSDNSVEPLSKIEGLSELNISTLQFDPQTRTLLIAYANANIDLLQNGKIINLSDIKRKNLTGDKNIYGIAFRDELAYLSCGFGIVVVDLIRREIKDTYIIGPAGTAIKVFDIDFLGNYIYAATENGVYAADLSNPNLSFYNNWTITLPDNGNAGDYNLIETFQNKVFVNYAKPNAASNISTDEIFMFDGTTWGPPPFFVDPVKNRSLHASGGYLALSNSFSVRVYDQWFQNIQLIYDITYPDPVVKDALMDQDQNTWIADNEQGLVKVPMSGPVDYIFPDGPRSDLVSAMSVVNSHLWVTHATRTAMWFNAYLQGNFSEYKNRDWYTYNSKTLTSYNITLHYDNMSLAVDPLNSNHVFIGSKGNGILEMLNGVPITSYRDTNSTLQVGVGNPNECQVVGMAFDKNQNLWALNSLTVKPVNVRKANGEWRAFSIPGIPGAPLFGDLTIDSYGQKWINVLGNNNPLGTGLVVFSDNSTLDDVNDDQSRFLTTGPGKGNLPSTDIRAITEDLDGEIWLGTGKGVAVIYSPGNVLTADNFDAQQILIKQDGVNQYLLESEVVTAIAVDGANRKWIGTESGGVFLMSADGTQEIINFNEENSPLLSNYILAIAIDQKTGEVFFGTNRGIISYMGDAVLGDKGCKDILVYPNPVRETYDGPIAIRGLVPNGSFKITDVNGNLVYEGKSNGSQAIWYGKNFEGRRAQTGVYLVFSSDEEGENKCVTKLLFIN